MLITTCSADKQSFTVVLEVSEGKWQKTRPESISEVKIIQQLKVQVPPFQHFNCHSFADNLNMFAVTID